MKMILFPFSSSSSAPFLLSLRHRRLRQNKSRTGKFHKGTVAPVRVSGNDDVIKNMSHNGIICEISFSSGAAAEEVHCGNFTLLSLSPRLA
jgi:hypothetical protein